MHAARHKPVAALRATALRLLARRDYPRAALEARLLARGAERGELTALLDDLERLGYLSDARYAAGIVAQRVGRYGKRSIAHTLAGRGVASDIAREALDRLGGTDEFAEAAALCRRRFPDPPADERERAKRIRFLTGRGYGLSIALKVVQEAISESPHPPREESTGES